MLMAWAMEVAGEASMAGEKQANSRYICGVELTRFADDFYVEMKR